MSITAELIILGQQYCLNETITEVRIGLGYTYVELSDGAAGIAWTPDRNPISSCTHLKRAGDLHEANEQEVLELLDGESNLERAVGLAAFNAVNSRVEREFNNAEAVSRLDINSTDHVVMVGHFAPVVSKIQKTGCRLDVLDLTPEKSGIIDLRTDPEILAQCDVAIITATSIINNTVDELLGKLRRNRTAVMLGPSTPLCPEPFKHTRISQLSGSRVMNREQVKQVISQGGGTMLMKKHLQFVNVDV